MKTKVFNLIILDESGSMYGVSRQTISGCNETIDTIKAAQNEYGETQENYISIFTFQSGSRPSHYIIKNERAEDVKHIDSKDYSPLGATPLYDAVGSTLSDLKSTVKNEELAIGSVTIITDGEENSSRIYDHQKIANMISALKELGWNFTFIGANIDVERTARSLNIDNHLEFEQDEIGTEEMFKRENRSRMAYASRINSFMSKSEAWGSYSSGKPSVKDFAKLNVDYFDLAEDEDSDEDEKDNTK